MARHTPVQQIRPMRQLMEGLARSSGASKAQRRQLAEEAALVMNLCRSGVSAVGKLIALTATEIDDGTVGAEAIEAVGWLLVELTELQVMCTVIAAAGRPSVLQSVNSGGPG